MLLGYRAMAWASESLGAHRARFAHRGGRHPDLSVVVPVVTAHSACHVALLALPAVVAFNEMCESDNHTRIEKLILCKIR